MPPDASGEVAVTLETRTLGTAVQPAASPGASSFSNGREARPSAGSSPVVRFAGFESGARAAHSSTREAADAATTRLPRTRSGSTRTRSTKRRWRRCWPTLDALPYRPLISVITPVHNTPPDVLAACMRSVRGQAYPNWEHCVADDGSTTVGHDVGSSSVLGRPTRPARDHGTRSRVGRVERRALASRPASSSPFSITTTSWRPRLWPRWFDISIRIRTRTSSIQTKTSSTKRAGAASRTSSPTGRLSFS